MRNYQNESIADLRSFRKLLLDLIKTNEIIIKNKSINENCFVNENQLLRQTIVAIDQEMFNRHVDETLINSKIVHPNESL